VWSAFFFFWGGVGGVGPPNDLSPPQAEKFVIKK